FYDKEGWDFTDRDLRDSVREWRESRHRTFAFVQSLSPERLSRTGSHRTFGETTVVDYLKIDLGHDREHFADLNEMLGGRARTAARARKPYVLGARRSSAAVPRSNRHEPPRS